MKKYIKTTILSCLAVAALTTTATAKSDWFVGLSAGSAVDGERIYESNTMETSLDVEQVSFKIGKIQKDKDRWELEFSQHTITPTTYLLGNELELVEEKFNTIRFNTVTSLQFMSYKELFVPYIEAGIGWGQSDNEYLNGEFVSNLGLGVMSNLTESFQLDVKYRLDTNIGSSKTTDDVVTNSYGGMHIGVNYIF